MDKKFIKKIRLVLWLSLFIIVGFLLYQAIMPNGVVKYTYDFSRPDIVNHFINKLTPKERLKIINNNIQAVIGEPVYFSLRTLRKFDKAKITLQYQNPNDLPFAEIGLLKDKIIWRYDLKPITNKTLNQLILAWSVVYGTNGEMLIQREKKYQTVNEFLKNLPSINEIAVYNYDFKSNYLLPKYSPTKQENKISQPLRGSYQFYTYIKNEKLDFKFSFSSLNQNKNKDSIKLNLYYQDKIIDSQKIDGNDDLIDNGKKIDQGELHFDIDNLSEGVYKIELVANDDIITEQIIFKQSKLSFINRLWLADGAKNIKIQTDSNLVSAQTVNPASLQTIKVGDNNLILAKTYQQFDIASHKKSASIELDKGDVILFGNGVFSFDQNSFFEPVARKVDNGLDINANGINYIIVKYQQPKEVDKWQVAEAEFDLTNAYREYSAHQLGYTNKMNFLISILGLNAEDDIDDKIIFGKITVELYGRSLLDRIKGIFYEKK
ncbi:MAG: hypothetical protein Q7T79_03895 [bacterium]|nr:hypothetical protein [bacterium]